MNILTTWNDAKIATKLTVFASAAIAGAVSGVTERARKPSGTNKMRLRWLCAWTDAICSRTAAQTAKRRTDDPKDMAIIPIFLL